MNDFVKPCRILQSESDEKVQKEIADRAEFEKTRTRTLLVWFGIQALVILGIFGYAIYYAAH